jgi:hypothetical protein
VLERPGELSLNAASQLQQLIFVHLVAPSAGYHAPVELSLHDFEAESLISHKKDAELARTGEGRERAKGRDVRFGRRPGTVLRKTPTPATGSRTRCSTPRAMRAGRRRIEVTWLTITEDGRQALAG